MNQILYSLFSWYFKTCARILMWRFKPIVICITGTVGKTTTKDVISAAIKSQYGDNTNKADAMVRATLRSQNSDLTTPLSILGYEIFNKEKNPLVWAHCVLLALVQLFASTFPKYLVLEVGAGKPGDVSTQAKWLQPDISIFTALSSTPVHVEFFESPEHVFEEKKKLGIYAKDTATLIYPSDDVLLEKTLQSLPQKKVRVSFDQKISLPGVLGESYNRSYAIALAVCEQLDMSVHSVQKHIARYFVPQPGRMRILKGIRNSTVIDDSYNASPLAVSAAVKELAEYQTPARRIFVFGDMKELGEYSDVAHAKVGREVHENCIHMFITIGTDSKIAADEAVQRGYGKENTRHFLTSYEAGKWLADQVKKDDVILAKSSRHAIKMEQALKHIVDPAEVKNLVQEYL